MAEVRKLKRAVIKEEYVAITGNYIAALILNQFIYWSERAYDFDKYLEQEKNRARVHGATVSCEETSGWVYKTADELNEELMLGLTANTVRKYIKILIEKGFLSERKNPIYKWDNTLQYRVNMVAVEKALQAEGYALSEYRIAENKNDFESPIVNAKAQNEEISMYSSNNSAYTENNSAYTSNFAVQKSKSFGTIPEITTEITTEINTEITTETNTETVCGASDDTPLHTASPQPQSKKSTKEPKHRYGEYQHVLLTDTEIDKLKNEYGTQLTDEAVTFLDSYIEEKRYKANSHYLSIRRWVMNAIREKQERNKRVSPAGRTLTKSEQNNAAFDAMFNEFATKEGE